MSVRYQTILAHLKDQHVFKPPLAYAQKLAQAHDAHLIGLTVLPAFNERPPAEVHFRELIDRYRQSLRDEAALMQAHFEKAEPIETGTREWRFVDLGFRPQVETVATQSSCADIVITSQDDPDGSILGFSDSAGLLVTLSPRPVILVPRVDRLWEVPRRVLVAWNGRAESTRALFDALPLLKQAESVTIVVIRSLEERTCGVLMKQLEDLSMSLARHGIRADCKLEVPDESGDGPTILAIAKRLGAELLVMGAYGHSRLGQSIFGGVTRHILQHMQTPVLLSR